MLLQRRMRALRSQVTFPLDSISSILLVWIGYKPVLQFGELQQFLKIPKASLSRLMKSLVELGYLKSRISDVDSRKKHFVYTPKGVKLLSQLDTINNRLVRVGAFPLTAEEITKITTAVDAIATGLGAPFDPERPGEEPLFTQIRRLSRISCMIGSNYMGINHDIMIYHIISELGFSGQPIPLQFFLKTLQIPPSSLSREIATLVSRGWLHKEPARHDRKLLLLKLTDKGRRHFESCEEAISTKYRAALSGVPTSTIQSWIDILKRFEGLEPPTINEAPIFAERCETEASLKRVRAFIVEELVRTKRHTNLPNTILPAGQICISVREADTTLAIAFAPPEQAGTEAHFSSIFLSQEVSTPQLAREVFSKASECLCGKRLPVKLDKEVIGHEHLINLRLAGADRTSPLPASASANPLHQLPSLN